MSNEKPQITLVCHYNLTAEAHTYLVLDGQKISRAQSIEITVDAEEAIRAGAAYVTEEGEIRSDGKCSNGLLAAKVWPSEIKATTAALSWPKCDDMDCVLTQEEALILYQKTLDARVKARGEIALLRAAVEADRTSRIATIRAAWSEIMAGQHKVEEVQVRVGDTWIPLEWLTDAEVQQIRAEVQRRAHQHTIVREAALEKAEAERQERREAAKTARAEWIQRHGSRRLQLSLETDTLDQTTGVYRDEWVQRECPGWLPWISAPEADDNDRINPEESELEALVEARKTYPDVQLRSVGGDGCKWRPALLAEVEIPVFGKTWIVKYLTN